MSHIIAFAQTVSNALGKIFGWKFEVGGGGVTNDLETGAGAADDIASGMGEAADNAKKLRSHLLAIDELNVYEPTEDSSSSGGGGLGNLGGGGGGASGGEWVKQDSIWKDFESEIDSLYELGEYIGKVLTDMMNSIDWEKVYEKARNFGKGLADFLNGLISPELFGAVGRTIAGALNTAIYAALSFGETFDWKDFGLSLATGLNEFFLTFDFASLATSINVWVSGILDTIIVFLEKTDWKMIGEKIGTFLSEIDFLDIGMKVGKAIWEAINAGFEMLGGMFNKAPFETIILSVAAFKTVWDKLIKVKVVPWINKITKALKGFGNAILALSGSQKALSALIVDFPKLGSAVDVARQAFANFQFGIVNGNLFSGLSLGIKTVRDNLTGLQKGAITAIAGFAEFKIVSSSFEDIVLGSENVVASIAKIGTAVGVAATAMYTALGPAGLAIAGITGVVGAISGINKAFDDIRAEEIGQSIKNAMTVPGGVPISEIANQFKTAFSEAASGFDLISEKSSEMDNVQKNIENTWTEIYKIEEAMENGVLSVEEGKAQLETLFSELATLTEQKFSTMNSVIMSAYGENGSFRTALDKIGVDTETAIDTMITYGYQSSERAKEIAKELVGVDVNSEEYKKLTAELASLTGEMSSFEKATSDFVYNMNSLQGKIDYSEIFLEDGSIHTETLKTYLNQATESLNEYKNSLDTAGQEVSQYWQEIYNSPIATEEQRAIAKSQLDYIPQAVEEMKSEAELQIVSFTDMLQNDFILKTSQMIDDSISEWNEKSAVEKWWNGVFGAGNEGEYVKEAVDQQQKNIDELSSVIQESLGELETDGVAWASEAAEEIYGALFDSQYIYSEMGSGHYKYTLNENYKEIINGATEGIAELAGERGKDAVDGYSNGITNNTSTGTEAAKTFIDKVMKKIAETQDSHSPSKVTESLGKDAVDGYNLGITNNQDSTKTAIESWMGIISTTMEEKWNEIKEWWNSTALVSFFEESIIPNFGYDKWYEVLGNGMFLAFQDKWNEFYAWWSGEVIPLWNEEQVEPNFGYDKWYEFLGNGMFLAFSEHIKLFLENWKQNISKWWKEDVEPWFKKEKWLELLQKVKDAFKESLTAIKENTKTIMNEMLEIVKTVVDEAVEKIGEIKTAAEEALGAIEALASKISGLSGGGISLNVSGFSMPAFATGGVVTRPTIGLFGESGAEAIVPLEKNAGWISSVADQLESYGSRDSEELLKEQNELLRQQNELLSYLADKEIIATLDTSRETINGFRSAERRLGYSFT